MSMSRLRWTIPAVVLFSVSPALAQTAAQRTDLYHVHFAQAASGKGPELQKVYTTPTQGAGHTIVLRHSQGSPWDFAVIEHIGPKATIELAASPTPARELRAWHEDTFAAGPPWDVFAKALGLDSAAGGAVFVVGTYRGAPGHRDQLEKTLLQLAAAAAKPEAGVLLQHVEGANWDFLAISRYDNWAAFAAEEADAGAEQRERKAGFTRSPGVELREHLGSHNDTFAVLVPPAAK
jgi:hypothetical protein